ncbi:MAG: hypothetical protein M3R06_09410 [Chloroflexota bacterium]|nr:hypothetical protein [Chloroflexota bacterium]
MIHSHLMHEMADLHQRDLRARADRQRLLDQHRDRVYQVGIIARLRRLSGSALIVAGQRLAGQAIWEADLAAPGVLRTAR